LHVGTFNSTFKGAVDKLDYLQTLGVNAVELLPIVENTLATTQSPADYDWGYDPAHLFAIKRKYGTPQEFKQLVKECHQRHIAVIVDVVYNHLAFKNLLLRFGGFSPSQIPAGIYFYGGIGLLPASVRGRILAARRCGNILTTMRCCCCATTVLMACDSTTRSPFAALVTSLRGVQSAKSVHETVLFYQISR
jgi:hypothetical protein